MSSAQRSNGPVIVAVAVLALVVGAVHGLRSYAPILFDVPISTASAFVLGFNVLAFLLAPLALAGLGYWAGTRTDVPAEYGTIALQFGLLGFVLYPLGFVAVAVFAFGTGGIGQFALSLAIRAVVQGTWFLLAGVAGAAIAHFQKHNT